MSSAKSLGGKCLCGAVSFTASGVKLEHHACHCEMCRRWAGSPFFGIHCRDVVFDGEQNLARFQSSEWAERGFCKRCGSSLFYFAIPQQHYAMSAGAFDDQSKFVLESEIFVDYKPPGYRFAGDHEMLTGQEFMEKWG